MKLHLLVLSIWVCICYTACKTNPVIIGPTLGLQESGFFRTSVYYATDRANSVNSKGYTGEVDPNGLKYGNVEVSIPDTHDNGELESPSWFNFWDRNNPTKYVEVLKISQFIGKDQFKAELLSSFGRIGEKDVLLFVHGYNVDFNEAAKRTAQMAYDLKFKGTPMFYSWPSKGTFSGYGADTESVAWSTPHFQEFLKFVLSDLGADNVHLIAHSMGNRAVAQALSDFDAGSLPSGSAVLNQVILAAPDVSVPIFKQLAANFPGKAQQITLYSSQVDKALLISRIFNNFERAGQKVGIFEGVVSVDATEVNTDFLSHSYFGKTILTDIAAIVKQDVPPDERIGLKRLTIPQGVYWFMDPSVF